MRSTSRSTSATNIYNSMTGQASEQPTLQESYLYLPEDALRFEPVSASVDVFYDELNQQVFAVHDRGSGGVEVLSPIAEHQLPLFRIADKGPIISIKFSYDIRILAIQRSAKSVEFCNYVYDRHTIDTYEYSQTCRSRSSKIIGFAWTGARQLVLVTDSKWELYDVQPNKQALRSNKSFNMQISWFLYYPPYFVIASGPQCSHLEIFYTRQQSGAAPFCFNKLDVDLLASYSGALSVEHEAVSPIPTSVTLLERDVALTTLYSNQLYLLVIRQPVRERFGAEILLYHIPSQPREPYVSHVLQLAVVGRFAINVLDNVLAVHHQQSKTSALFDIHSGILANVATGNAENTDSVEVKNLRPVLPVILQPLFTPRSIRLCSVQMLLSSQSTGSPNEQTTTLAAIRARSKERADVLSMPSDQSRTVECTLYASTWAVFYPNVIVDAKLGCFWELKIDYAVLLNATDQPEALIKFLANRTSPAAKHTLLAVPMRILLPPISSADASSKHSPPSLRYAACVFNALMQEICRINHQQQQADYSSLAINNKTVKLAGLLGAPLAATNDNTAKQQKQHLHDVALTVEQIFNGLLQCFNRCKHLSIMFAIGVITEVLRSAVRYNVEVPFVMYEALVTTLLESSNYAHLQYLVQYRIIADSKRMACLFLANSSLHKPVLQTSLDMLTRLEAHDEVVEILLSQGKILTALRYIEQRNVPSIDTRKFLQSAFESGDKDLFYTVYKYFERLPAINARRRVPVIFQELSHCDNMRKEFHRMFVDASK